MKKETALFLFLLVLWVLMLFSCNPLQKAENRVLANVESVKRIRAITDPLWPCANDSLVFIHDSTTLTNTEYQRDTLVDIRNDSTFIHYTDTVTITNTKTKVINTVVVDGREVSKHLDSINSLHLQLSISKGTISEQRFQQNKMQGERNIWRIVAFILFASIIFIGILKLKSWTK